ncbi:ALK tyrosine kinase receptor-like [Lithobates pipiens]
MEGKKEPLWSQVGAALQGAESRDSEDSPQVQAAAGGGWDYLVREGCGVDWESLRSNEGEQRVELPTSVLKRRLEFNLTELFSWWLETKEGRLRIRLMPQRSSAYPGMEDTLSAALGASQPRLMFQILRKGFHYVKTSSSNPLNFYTWNISWIMREVFSYIGPRPKHDFDCNFESHCSMEYSSAQNNNTWRVTSAEELQRHGTENGPKEDYSENSSTGHFLFLGSGGDRSPTVMSPWLRSNSASCRVEVAVFLQKTGGRYIVRLQPENLPISVAEASPTLEKSR